MGDCAKEKNWFRGKFCLNRHKATAHRELMSEDFLEDYTDKYNFPWTCELCEETMMYKSKGRHEKLFCKKKPKNK